MQTARARCYQRNVTSRHLSSSVGNSLQRHSDTKEERDLASWSFNKLVVGSATILILLKHCGRANSNGQASDVHSGHGTGEYRVQEREAKRPPQGIIMFSPRLASKYSN